MPKEGRMPKLDSLQAGTLKRELQPLTFGILPSAFFRHWAFDLWHYHSPTHHSPTHDHCSPHASPSTSSATKIGTLAVTARAMASLGRQSTSTSSPSWRMRSLAKYV